MGDKSKQGQSSTRHLNDYERSKRLRVQENQQRLQALGVKTIAKSLTSLVESEKTKKRTKKPMDTSEKDVEYMPDFDVDEEQDYEEEDATRVKVSNKVFILTNKLSSYNFIPFYSPLTIQLLTATTSTIHCADVHE